MKKVMISREERRMTMAYGFIIIQREFFMGARPFGVRFGVEEIS